MQNPTVDRLIFIRMVCHRRAFVYFLIEINTLTVNYRLKILTVVNCKSIAKRKEVI